MCVLQAGTPQLEFFKRAANAQLDTTVRPQRLVHNAQVESSKLALAMEMKLKSASNVLQVATVLLVKIIVPVVQLGTTVVMVVALALLALAVSQLLELRPLVQVSQYAQNAPKVPTRVMDWQPRDVWLVGLHTVLKALVLLGRTHRLAQSAHQVTQDHRQVARADVRCALHQHPTQQRAMDRSAQP